MRRQAGWLVLLATALMAGACSSDDAATTSAAPTTAPPATTTPPQATAPTTTIPPTTTTLASAATDGTTSLAWSRVQDGDLESGQIVDQAMLNLTRGGAGLIAVGWEVDAGNTFDAAVWTSADGIDWSRVSLGAARGAEGNQAMLSVTPGGPGLVAVGIDDWGGDEDAAVWTSPDGIEWSRVPHAEDIFGGSNAQRMFAVTAGGPGLVAVGWAVDPGDGFDAAAWTSADGAIWSRAADEDGVLGGEAGQRMFAVTAGGPGLVAVGLDESNGDGDAAVWTSPDGVTWARVSHDDAVFGGAGEQVMVSIGVGEQGLVAVGTDASDGEQNAAVWTSPDGVGWARVPHDEAVFGGTGNQAMVSIAAGTSGFVVVGVDDARTRQDAAVWTSADGTAWERVPHDEDVLGGVGDQVMWSVAVGGPGRVAVGWEGFVGGGQDAAVWVKTDR